MGESYWRMERAMRGVCLGFLLEAVATLNALMSVEAMQSADGT
jgi:hypothetical protein